LCVTVGMQSARGLVPAAAAAAPPACVRRPAQLRSVQVAARRSSRSRHVSLTPCASPDGDKLTSVQRSLETNSQALSESTSTTTTVTSTVTSNAEAVAALNALIEEERRLAALEAQLAEAEKGISANERQMLDLLLQRQALAAAQPDVQEMQSRLRSTEAEAAVRVSWKPQWQDATRSSGCTRAVGVDRGGCLPRATATAHGPACTTRVVSIQPATQLACLCTRCSTAANTLSSLSLVAHSTLHWGSKSSTDH
jgi:uncharacterized protein with PIN domain